MTKIGLCYQLFIPIFVLLLQEPYEVLDISGVDGPKQSRLTRNEKSLLKGYKIYPAPPFVSTTQTDVEVWNNKIS